MIPLESAPSNSSHLRPTSRNENVRHRIMRNAGDSFILMTSSSLRLQVFPDLSYTTFKCSNLKTSSGTSAKDRSITVGLAVKNPGKRAFVVENGEQIQIRVGAASDDIRLKANVDVR